MTAAVAAKKATKRSRIEGTLHRSLPVTIEVLRDGAGDANTPLPEVLRLRLSVSSETPYLRTSWWDDPWNEVLGHDDGEVDLTRMNGGAAVLANHDRYTAVGDTPLAGIGVVEKSWIQAKRLYCDIALSRREGLADLRQDIADGLVRNVSIGYIINERVLVKSNGDGKPDDYRVTSWMPFEVSLVDIPADATVGLGRSADGTQQPNATPGYRVVNLSPAAGATPQETRVMDDDDTITAPANNQPAAAPQPQTRSMPAAPAAQQQDPLTAERARVREITAMGRTLGLGELAERAINEGVTLDAFRAQVIQAQVDSGRLRRSETPEIGMSRREIQSFSFVRALLAAADPAQAAKLAPFELECSRAAQGKRGESRPDSKLREAAITIPVDVLNRGIAIPEDAAASVARMMIARASRGAAHAQEMLRDLTVGTANAGGNTVATELFGSSFIDLLRNALVLDRMGVTMLRDLNGNIAIPSQTAGATHYWVAESGAPTESQATFGQVTLSPKTVGAFTDYSRRLLLQSSIDIEAFVRADLAAVIAQGILLAAINGSGSSNEPTGVLNTSGIGAVPLGTNGAAPTYASLVDLEAAVALVNADVGNLAFLTNTKVRGKLRKTETFASTNGQPVWGKGRETGLGDVMGYDAYVTNAVPSTLTKGTSSGVCSANIFGNWADMIIGMWGGLDVLLDPYTGATSGTRRVVALQDLDIALRRVGSFAATKDILTT